jgi:hypothetical protein
VGASRLSVAIRYLWASPATLVGLLLALVALALGATARVRRGAIEVAGGRVESFAARMPRPMRFAAITFGHVIVGATHDVLHLCRDHEHVHVRQYERWGALLLFLYPLASLYALIRGRDPYRDNRFEREAFAKASRRHRSASEA